MKAAKLLGLVMICAVVAWDVDALRLHIMARSWTTLAYVSLYPLGHILDYLTVGRLHSAEWVTI